MPVERLVACDRRQPGGRIVGYAVDRPLLERHHERVLKGILGQVPIPGEPDEGGQHLATLDPQNLFERRGH